MKELIIRLSTHGSETHGVLFIRRRCYSYYPEYDVAICKLEDFKSIPYSITDIKSGMSIKRFKTLKDAKQYFTSNEWKTTYERVLNVRNNAKYKELSNMKHQYMIDSKLIKEKDVM